jgi:N-acetylglutamate synthase-like GNAT family acetyltransferase
VALAIIFFSRERRRINRARPGCTTLFALSTEALDWFEERGFERSSVEADPVRWTVLSFRLSYHFA